MISPSLFFVKRLFSKKSPGHGPPDPRRDLQNTPLSSNLFFFACAPMPLDDRFAGLVFPASSARLDLAANAGRFAPDPDAGSELLIEAASHPDWTNADLLSHALIRANRSDPAGHDQWIANLLEFCVWSSLSQPRRLALCQELVARGAPFVHEPSWAHFGGLAHAAAEGGSLEALLWARSLAPEDLFRPGGSFGLSPLHCAALRSDPHAVPVIEALLSWGLDASCSTQDGRNALFRVQDPDVASALIRSGADPLALDRRGFCALGFWLEVGFWDLARLCFTPDRPLASLNQPLSFGSFAHVNARPSRDLPAAIYAGSRHAQRSAAFAPALVEMARWGADFHLIGPDGEPPLSKLRQGPGSAALAALEAERLDQSLSPSSSTRPDRSRL